MEIENKALETFDFGVKYPNGMVGCEAVSMSFAANEVTAIIGPSGCGKSSFLKGLNRLTDEFNCRYKGSIILKDGKDIMNLDPYELCILRGDRIGYVMQKPVPFSGKSIFQDVAMPLRSIGVSDNGKIRAKVKAALKKAALWDEVEDRLENLSTSLSGGQQQRLCIARAIINTPDILLLDEPCSSLDPKSTQLVENLILELAAEHTVVIVTHNMQQAQRVAHRTAFFYEGRLVEYDFTNNIFSNPSNELTSDYIIGKFS
ncbi:Phosphate transport ATP-binding protein PstB (TC 3.A.1.7.1) [hydrothermal vent metagenome]|uniref:Phosphate transport ATP-binding protein PstB (TC 3.A.1.7.1) n=1 Tax=hydrothermal vent metagenome TaxID=652676 RepID=A0A3B1D442_9ZZZZ